jgi:hypothetical protein
VISPERCDKARLALRWDPGCGASRVTHQSSGSDLLGSGASLPCTLRGPKARRGGERSVTRHGLIKFLGVWVSALELRHSLQSLWLDPGAGQPPGFVLNKMGN